MSDGKTPVIRWVGSKRSVLQTLLNLLPGDTDQYVEPFVGGGALALAQPLYGSRMFIADSNVGLMCMYKAIVSAHGALIAALQDLRFAHEMDASGTFERCKSEYNRTIILESTAWRSGYVLTGALFMYLQATSFNGVYRTNKKGEYNVPMGDVANPRICDADGIRGLHYRLQGACIELQDFRVTVGACVGQGTLIYADPPYDVPESYNSFTAYGKSGFNWSAQVDLAKELTDASARGCKFMASNADTPRIRELYAGYNIETSIARRSVSAGAAQRGRVQELIIRNYT